MVTVSFYLRRDPRGVRHHCGVGWINPRYCGDEIERGGKGVTSVLVSFFRSGGGLRGVKWHSHVGAAPQISEIL